MAQTMATILLVEDERELGQLVARELEATGYRVRQARGGSSGRSPHPWEGGDQRHLIKKVVAMRNQLGVSSITSGACVLSGALGLVYALCDDDFTVGEASAVSLKARKPAKNGTHKRVSNSGSSRSKPASPLKIRASDNVRVAEEIALVVEKARSRGGGRIEDESSRGC